VRRSVTPGTSLSAGGGKTGYLYVLNTANLGKYNAEDDQVVQKLQLATAMVAAGVVRHLGAVDRFPAIPQ